MRHALARAQKVPHAKCKACNFTRLCLRTSQWQRNVLQKNYLPVRTVLCPSTCLYQFSGQASNWTAPRTSHLQKHCHVTLPWPSHFVSIANVSAHVRSPTVLRHIRRGSYQTIMKMTNSRESRPAFWQIRKGICHTIHKFINPRESRPVFGHQ